MKSNILIILALLLLCCPASYSGDKPQASVELNQAIMECMDFVTTRCRGQSASGVPELRLFRDKDLSGFDLKCDAVVTAAGQRDDIIKSVELLRSAAHYDALAGEIMGKPLPRAENKELEILIKGPDGKPSPGRTWGACIVAMARLSATSAQADASEASIMKMSEQRYKLISCEKTPNSPAIPITPSDPGEAGVAGNSDVSPPDNGNSGKHPVEHDRQVPCDEVTIAILMDGSLTLDGKQVKENLLADVVKSHRTESTRKGSKMMFTICAGDDVGYDRVKRVLDILDKAGIDKVTFEVPAAQSPPNPEMNKR